MKILNKNGKVLAVMLIVFLMLIGLNHQAQAAPTCKDGTAIPSKVVTDGSESAYCKNHGGVSIGTNKTCKDGTTIPTKVITDGSESAYCKNHGGVSSSSTTSSSKQETITAACDPAQTYPSSNPCSAANKKVCTSDDGCVNDIFQRILIPFINFLSAAVGIVVIAMIIVGGIQYSASGSEAAKVQAAKKKISNALIALVAYIFLFSFLQWLVPGGLF